MRSIWFSYARFLGSEISTIKVASIQTIYFITLDTAQLLDKWAKCIPYSSNFRPRFNN